MLDNCQHVLLGCCTELQQLYRTLGVNDLIRFDAALNFADRTGRRGRLYASALPSPLHMAPSFIGFGLLKWGQKLEIAKGMAGMLGVDRDQAAGESFGLWLRERGQSAGTIGAYWDVICVSALNETCDQVSAKYGLQVFQEAFLRGRDGYRLGYAKVPLSILYRLPRGVEARMGVGVRRLIERGGRVCGVALSDGSRIEAGQVIVTTPPPATWRLIQPVVAGDPRLAAMTRLTYSPIIGAHLRYDRPVLEVSPVAMLGTKLHWAFADEADPRLVHGVVSAAGDLCAMSGEDVSALLDSEIRLVFAQARDAKLVDGVIVKDMRATFRPVPGVDAYRPSQRTWVGGLSLAGDYTRTDWPATMEGAARSGRLAAEVVMGEAE